MWDLKSKVQNDKELPKEIQLAKWGGKSKNTAKLQWIRRNWIVIGIQNIKNNHKLGSYQIRTHVQGLEVRHASELAQLSREKY